MASKPRKPSKARTQAKQPPLRTHQQRTQMDHTHTYHFCLAISDAIRSKNETRMARHIRAAAFGQRDENKVNIEDLLNATKRLEFFETELGTCFFFAFFFLIFFFRHLVGTH